MPSPTLDAARNIGDDDRTLDSHPGIVAMLDQLKLLIRSENPIIALDTRDEAKAVELVRKAADDMALPLFEWTITAGMNRVKPTAAETGVKGGKAGPALDYLIDNKGDPEIYLFKDLGPHTKDAVVQRQLRDLCAKPHLTLIAGRRRSVARPGPPAGGAA